MLHDILVYLRDEKWHWKAMQCVCYYRRLTESGQIKQKFALKVAGWSCMLTTLWESSLTAVDLPAIYAAGNPHSCTVDRVPRPWNWPSFGWCQSQKRAWTFLQGRAVGSSHHFDWVKENQHVSIARLKTRLTSGVEWFLRVSSYLISSACSSIASASRNCSSCSSVRSVESATLFRLTTRCCFRRYL